MRVFNLIIKKKLYSAKHQIYKIQIIYAYNVNSMPKAFWMLDNPMYLFCCTAADVMPPVCQPACLPACPDPCPCTEIPFTTTNRLTAHTMRRTNIVSHLLGTRTRARAKARAVATYIHTYFCRLCVYNKGSSVSQLRCDCGRGSRANERPNVASFQRNELWLRLSVYMRIYMCVCLCVRGYEVYVCIYSESCLKILLCVISA